jgi:hypothetical protein
MAVTGAIRVDFNEVMWKGAWLASEVTAAKDWDASTKDNFVQRLVVDEEGKPIQVDGLDVKVWQVQVMDRDPAARPDQRLVTVWLASPRQPVPPPPPDEDSPALVELVGMSMLPKVDRRSCRAPRDGEAHFCKSKVTYEFWATDLRAPERSARARAAVANGRGEAG